LSKYRITLVCQTPINNIPFFSYAISSNPTTAQVLMQMLVAVAEICDQKGGNARVVEVIYDDDSAHNPPGCGSGNCRLLTTFSAF
jgi:hypothetical protein